jgi:hypothetical protein
VANLPHHGHTPCRFSSVQILPHLLQCPVIIAYPLSFALKVGKRSALALLYSIVKVLLIFQLYHPTKGTIVKHQDEPIFS